MSIHKQNTHENRARGILIRLGGALIAVAFLVGIGAGSAQAAPNGIQTAHAGRPVHDPEREARLVAQSGDIGIMMQGGFDRDHWWLKISRTELITIGANAACAAILRGPWAVVLCPPLVSALNWAVAQFPVANGFWAEVYTDGRVKIGTW